MNEQQVIPTLREILNAKVVDALVELEQRREAGEINEHEWYIARQTLFQAFSGMAMPDVFELLATNEPDSFKERRVQFERSAFGLDATGE